MAERYNMTIERIKRKVDNRFGSGRQAKIAYLERIVRRLPLHDSRNTGTMVSTYDVLQGLKEEASTGANLQEARECEDRRDFEKALSGYSCMQITADQNPHFTFPDVTGDMKRVAGKLVAKTLPLAEESYRNPERVWVHKSTETRTPIKEWPYEMRCSRSASAPYNNFQESLSLFEQAKHYAFLAKEESVVANLNERIASIKKEQEMEKETAQTRLKRNLADCGML